MPSSNGFPTQDEVNRKEALGILISALTACPQMADDRKSGEAAAKWLIDGADALMTYILNGKKPN